MINPYQAPQAETPGEESAPSELESHLSVEFQLSNQQIRKAENRFLLYRCGIRLTIASLLMISLSIYVAGYVGEQFGVLSAFNWISPTLVVAMLVSQLLVMLLAAIVYQSLIWGVRRRVRQQLRSLGVVADTRIEVALRRNQLHWNGSTGNHVFPLDNVAFRQFSVGLLAIVGRDQFLLIPRQNGFLVGDPFALLTQRLIASSSGEPID